MKETIKTLRLKCQSTRPSIFNDFLSKFYYFISIYFTWFLINLKFTSNRVTILSGLVCIVASYFLSTGEEFGLLFGCILLSIFSILDMSDGEVARYHDQGSMEGHFLDWIMHFVYSISISIGLSINYLSNNLSIESVLLCLLFVSLSILDKAFQASAWTVICWTRIRNGVDFIYPNNNSFKQSVSGIPKLNLFYKNIKVFILSPFLDHWIPISLPVFYFSSYYLCIFLGIEIHPLAIYIPMFTLVSFALIVRNIYSLVNSKRMKISYNKLTTVSKIQLPNDDFV